MSVLVFGHARDIHTAAAAWALEQLNKRVDVFSYSDFPDRARFSFDQLRIRLNSPTCDCDLLEVDTVWNRRLGRVGSPDWLHPDDRETARATNKRALDFLRRIQTDTQIWVNAPSAQQQISSKMNQLLLARSVGLHTPRTLISNDGARIAEFVRSTNCIMKPLMPMIWSGENARRETSTVPVTAEDCSDPRRLNACPMIYQERIEKAYELRVVAFGPELLCVRIDSQAREDTALDWRIFNYRDLEIAEIPCPDDLGAKLRAFMTRAGLLHGSFDLAVTPDGETIFFEINEQGQTLWIEEIDPQIRVLDRLAQFLASPGPDFVWEPGIGLGFPDFMASGEGERLLTNFPEVAADYQPVRGVARAR